MLFLLALGAASLASNAGAAGFVCGKYSTLIESFARIHNEAPAHAGVTANGDMIQVLVSPEGETWTVLSVRPTGIACIMAVGVNWDVLSGTDT